MSRIWQFIKDKARKVKSFFTKKRMLEATYFTGGLALSTYVFTYLLPRWLALTIVGVTLIHEMGHYFQGHRLKARPWLPYFVPAVYFLFAGTYIDEEDPGINAQISLVGPAMGIAASLAFMLGYWMAGFMPGVYACGWLLTFQVWAGTFGSDGRNYRRLRAEERTAARPEGAWRDLASVG